VLSLSPYIYRWLGMSEMITIIIITTTEMMMMMKIKVNRVKRLIRINKNNTKTITIINSYLIKQKNRRRRSDDECIVVVIVAILVIKLGERFIISIISLLLLLHTHIHKQT